MRKAAAAAAAAIAAAASVLQTPGGRCSPLPPIRGPDGPHTPPLPPPTLLLPLCLGEYTAVELIKDCAYGGASPQPLSLCLRGRPLSALLFPLSQPPSLPPPFRPLPPPSPLHQFRLPPFPSSPQGSGVRSSERGAREDAIEQGRGGEAVAEQGAGGCAVEEEKGRLLFWQYTLRGLRKSRPHHR